MLHAPIADAARFTHEGHLHRRQRRFGHGARNARWTRQIEGICHLVEIVAHAQNRVIDDIVGPVGASVTKRRQTGCRQIIGMDMVTVTILAFVQGRHTTPQTFNGQAPGTVDTRRAQNTDPHPVPGAPGTQAALGINPPCRTTALWIERTGLVDHRAGTITVHTSRAHVNQAAW